jgi:hypothetical protein
VGEAPERLNQTTAPELRVWEASSGEVAVGWSRTVRHRLRPHERQIRIVGDVLLLLALALALALGAVAVLIRP